MRNRKQPAVLWSIAGIVLSLCTILCAVIGSNSSPKVLLDSAAIVETAEQTLECVRSGDYDTLTQLLYGSPRLGEAPVKTDEPESVILFAFLDSIHYDISQECYASGSGVALDVHIDYLDISAVSEKLQAIVPDLMIQLAESKEKPEIFDEERNYQPAFLEEVLCTATAQVLSQEPPITERDITLEFVRSGDGWLVVPTESLTQLLSGYISE